jgi:nicotinic acid phosphoribosyltransferase
MFLTADPKDILDGRITDVYFERALKILKAKGVNPVVKAEFIAKTLPKNWPWALLTASNVAWLLYDALDVLGPALGFDARATRTSTELFRALGCTLGFTAGLAQRAVVDHLRRLGGPPPAS